MMNERLRAALLEHGVSTAQLGDHVGVDRKTVERWIAGRVPFPRHRHGIAAFLGVTELSLWPGTLGNSRWRGELVSVYGRRSQVPADAWGRLFTSAEREIGVLAFAGLFLSEDTAVRSSRPSTHRRAPGTACQAGQFVVKPAVSAGVNGTATYDQPRIPKARRHISALHAAGRAVLIQPYCHRVDSDAETGVIFIDGQVSHAVRKGPLLRIGQPPESGPWRDEDISPRHPAADVLQLARQAHACAVRRFGTPLYARADVIRDDAGAPQLLELELIEPSLFLQLQPASAAALATALHARLSPRRGQPITERR